MLLGGSTGKEEYLCETKLNIALKIQNINVAMTTFDSPHLYLYEECDLKNTDKRKDVKVAIKIGVVAASDESKREDRGRQKIW